MDFSIVLFSLFQCLPSPGGLLGLSASQPPLSACSAANSKDSFVTTRSNKASKDCPVGFADVGSVSVVYLQFSLGSSVFVCMSCWSHDLTLQRAELKAQRCQLTVPSASIHRTVVFTGCWLTTDRTSESFSTASCRRKLNVCMTALDRCNSQSLSTHMLPPSARLVSSLAFSLRQEVGISELLVCKFVNLPRQVKFWEHFSGLGSTS